MPDLDHARAFSFGDLRDAINDPDGPVLVEFWEPRCSACRATLHTIDELACRMNGHSTVGTFNVKKNPEAARSLGVQSVPTLLVLRNGNVESFLEGADAIQTFVQRIDEEVFLGMPPICGS